MDSRKRQAEEQPLEGRRQQKHVLENDEEASSEGNYDPDQDIEERRMIRKGLRDLNKTLLENRSEFLNPESTGLEDTITQANKLSRQVKQTSDATIDSNLLAIAADITYKRTIAIVSGNNGQGVDIDDFINKCKAFMRQGDGDANALHNTLSQRARNDEENEDNDDDILNWEYLAEHACIQHIGRPRVPGFLLGPLSTEKKAKRTITRKATFRIGSLKETRPEVLSKDDIVQDEDMNLSTMCQKITTKLEKVRGDAMAAAEAETRDDMTDKEVEALLDKYCLSKEAGISLFRFVINPYSFGQTVENLFYVSFLIRDGKMAITLDDRGIPYLELRDDEETSNNSGNQIKHQAVLDLDMASWQELIDVFDVKEPMIPHREEPDSGSIGNKGWYA
ncbi:hypothetical protein K3495_g1575 [Podosphaera aphanis]|nr:hypothetical protein K3495_g1575 [Podosphaera aphanis]